MIDLCIDRIFRHKVADDNGVALLPAAVDTADPLFDCHWVPRKIVIDHEIAELIVQTFAADLGEQKDIQRIYIVCRKFKTLAECQTFLIFHAAVYLCYTVSFFCKMLLYIAERVTERAEQDDLIILLAALVFYNFQKTLQLFIGLRKILREFDHMVCHCAEFSFQRAHVQIFKVIDRESAVFITIVRENIAQTASDHAFQQRRKAKNAAGSLPHQSAHHKLQRHIVVQIAERMAFKIHQCIIEFFLLRGKMDRNTLRTAHAEIVLNILTAGAVDHVRKAVQSFHILKDPHTCSTVDRLPALELCHDIFIGRVVFDDAVPPAGLCSTGKVLCSLRTPVFGLMADQLCCCIDLGIRLLHFLECFLI